MTNKPYMRDTKKFWQVRKGARASLDQKRANATYSEKLEIVGKLRSDAALLKSGRIITSSKR